MASSQPVQLASSLNKPFDLDSLVTKFASHYDSRSPRQESMKRCTSVTSNIARDFVNEYKDEKHPLEELDNYTMIEKIKDFCEDNDCDLETLTYVHVPVDAPPVHPKRKKLKQRIKACIKVLFQFKDKLIRDGLIFVNVYSNEQPKTVFGPPGSLNPSESKIITPLSTLPFEDDKVDYDKIETFFRKEISALVKNKDVEQIRKEAENKDCVKTLFESNYKDIMKCPCIARICVILSIYHEFECMVKEPIRPIHIGNKLRLEPTYGDQQIADDFDHIRNRHFQNNDDAQKSICAEIVAKYPCIEVEKCHSAKRHKLKKLCELDELPPLSQVVSSHSDYDEADVVHSQRCDRIHYYFMHSQVKNGKLPMQLNTNDDEKKQNVEFADKLSATRYLGVKEDKAWMGSISDIEITNEQKVYDTMVTHMGGFQWQTPFGFRSHRGLTNIKPNHKNIKQEVLHNVFYGISADSWNQTLRKCQVFHASWSGKAIRTKYDGSFHDDVMHHHAEWKKGEPVSLQDVITLKLYTDFDKLQSELKKCFRSESMDEIVEDCSRGHPTMMSSSQDSGSVHPDLIPPLTQQELKEDRSTEDVDMFTQREELKAMNTKRNEESKLLEKRLKEFYHWRGKLLIFLNKFSTILSNTLDRKQNDFSLYHGINTKMMVSPDETTAFFGPLSTSSSYHVAKTFATDKGVVLSISTQYQRLNMCRVFDASLMSDYPEEQEWLIGFIYLRVMKVYTKMKEKVPMESHMRFAFFAIHLFQKQLFSMNNALEEALEAFIQHQLFVRNNINRNNYKEMKENEKNEGAQYLEKVHNWAKGLKDDKPSTIRFDDNTVKDENPLPRGIDKHLNDEERARYDRVVYMLTKKFEQFCLYPNVQQIVKFDSISAGLRKYFLKDSGKRITLPKEEEEIYYSVSFKKIVNLFPNVEEIHFLNWYKFDDGALESFIEEIVEKRDTKLKQIKFLYFDYKDTIEEHLFFVDPDSLNKENMQKLEKNWKLKFSKDRSGCRIRIKPLQ